MVHVATKTTTTVQANTSRANYWFQFDMKTLSQE